MAAGILSCFALIEVKKRQPKGSKLIGPLMHYHKSIGLLMGGFIVARLGLRAISKIPKPMEGPSWMHMAAKASHFGLYSLMIFMPATGISMGYFGGKGIPFFWTKVPGTDTPNKTIAKWSWKTHKWAGTAFEILVGIHFWGAVSHQLMGQSIFSRISPFAGTALIAFVDEEDDDDDDLFLECLVFSLLDPFGPFIDSFSV